MDPYDSTGKNIKYRTDCDFSIHGVLNNTLSTKNYSIKKLKVLIIQMSRETYNKAIQFMCCALVPVHFLFQENFNLYVALRYQYKLKEFCILIPTISSFLTLSRFWMDVRNSPRQIWRATKLLKQVRLSFSYSKRKSKNYKELHQGYEHCLIGLNHDTEVSSMISWVICRYHYFFWLHI